MSRCHVEDWKLHSRQPALLMWLVDDGIRDYISKKIRFAKILQKWDTSFMGSHRLRTILFWREIRYDTILTYFTVDKHHGGCSILVLYCTEVLFSPLLDLDYRYICFCISENIETLALALLNIISCSSFSHVLPTLALVWQYLYLCNHRGYLVWLIFIYLILMCSSWSMLSRVHSYPILHRQTQ